MASPAGGIFYVCLVRSKLLEGVTMLTVRMWVWDVLSALAYKAAVTQNRLTGQNPLRQSKLMDLADRINERWCVLNRRWERRHI